LNIADLSHIIVDMAEETMLKADGFDEAVLGPARRCGQTDIIAYDVTKIIDILMTRDGMDEEEALEYFEFNILGGWHGEGTPCFIFTDEKEDVLDEINWNQESN
tara:strand:+ start:58 stop:369 length:312 start_codon:yes stop_codon:yes gene_type:complete